MKKSLIALAALAACGARALGERFNDAVFGHMARTGLVSLLTTKSNAYTGQLPTRVQPIDQSVQVVPVPFDMPAAAPAINDVLALCKVPAGVEIVDYDLIVDDMDSGGAPAIAFTLGSLNAGLTAISTAYASAQTTMQTGGFLRAANNAHWLESSAAERSIGLLFTAAAATYAGAGKKGLLLLHVRG